MQLQASEVGQEQEKGLRAQQFHTLFQDSRQALLFCSLIKSGRTASNRPEGTLCPFKKQQPNSAQKEVKVCLETASQAFIGLHAKLLLLPECRFASSFFFTEFAIRGGEIHLSFLFFSLPSRCSKWHTMGFCCIFSSQHICDCLFPSLKTGTPGSGKNKSSVWQGDLSSTSSQQGSLNSGISSSCNHVKGFYSWPYPQV